MRFKLDSPNLNLKRTIWAFAIAPASVSILVLMRIFLGYYPLLVGLEEIKLYLILGYIWAFVFGIPIYWLMLKKSWSKWWQYMIAGFAAGTIFGLTMTGLGWQVVVYMGMYAGVIAGFSAIVFWAIVRPI